MAVLVICQIVFDLTYYLHMSFLFCHFLDSPYRLQIKFGLRDALMPTSDVSFGRHPFGIRMQAGTEHTSTLSGTSKTQVRHGQRCATALQELYASVFDPVEFLLEFAGVLLTGIEIRRRSPLVAASIWRL